MTRRLLFVVAGVLVVAPRIAHAGETVDETGAFHTDVTFDLPAYHSLEPPLALEYSSFAGPGDAGVGWHLTGSSTITRSGARRGAPVYDATDVLWLDGMELIPCASAPASLACMFGGTHATRVESFTRIVYDATANSWTVTTRDGVQSTYEAQVAWGGPRYLPDTYRWAVTRRTDPHGNAVRFTYDCERLTWPSVGDCVLVGIGYGDGAACHKSLDLPPLTPIAGGEVQLYWEPRDDAQSFGIGEAILESHRRLKTVEVKRGGAVLSAYALRYGRGSTSGRSILVGVDHAGTDAIVDPATGTLTTGTRLPTTTYATDSLGPAPTAWNLVTESSGGTTVTPSGPAYPTSRSQQGNWPIGSMDHLLAADVNGDGRTDFVKITGEHSIQTAIAKADGTYDLVTEEPFTVGEWTTGGYWLDSPTQMFWYAGDVNGDGRQDIMNVVEHRPICDTTSPAACNCVFTGNHVALRVAISKGDGHYAYEDQHIDVPYSAGVTLNWTVEWSVAVAVGPLSAGYSATLWRGQNLWIDEAWMVGDADGDGRTDFMRAQRYVRSNGVKAVRLQVFRSQGGTFTAPSSGSWELDTDWSWDDNSIAKDRFMAGDVNGDHRADFMIVAAHHQNLPGHTPNAHSALRTALSLGDGGFDLHEDDIGLDWGDNDIWFPGDHDGDGKIDFMRVQWHGKNYHSTPGWTSDHGAVLGLVSRGDGKFDTGGVAAEAPWPWHEPPPCVGNPTEAAWIPGDFDHDGRTDVAHVFVNHDYDCLHNPGHTITIGKILNRPGGPVLETTLVPGVDYYSDKQLLLASGDANGDGADDVLFAHAIVKEWRCTDTGKCADTYWYDLHTLTSPRTTNDTRNWQPTDVDGDGRQDLVYVHFTNPGYQVQTLLRHSSGALTPLGQSIASPAGDTLDNAGAHRFVAGDFGGPNGGPDGKGDLVLVDHDGTTLKIVTLLSQGDGTWTPVIDRPLRDAQGSPLPFGRDLANWLRADVNGDGMLDLVNTRMPVSGHVAVLALLAKGDGRWTPVESTPLTNHARNDTRQFRPADVNGDGREDLVYIGTFGTESMLAQADGTFVGVVDSLGGPADQTNWQIAELNGDGRHDFVYAHYSTPSGTRPKLSLTFLISRGNGTFERVVGPELQFWGGRYYGQTNALRVADFDGDGKSDLALMSRFAFDASTHVHWAMNQWPAFAPSDVGVQTAITTTDNWRPMDLDSDGRDDLAHAEGGLFGLRLPAPSDRLASIDNGMGGKRTIQYRASSGDHDLMPIGAVLQLVSQVTTDDALRGPLVDEERGYSFGHATWSFADRRLLGFTNVSSEDARGTINSTFALGECGPRALAVDRLGNVGGLIESTHNTYMAVGSAAPFRCLPSTQSHDECEGFTKCRTVESQYRYDTFGNVVVLTELGDVADPLDDRQTQTPVKANTKDWIIDRPAYRAVFETDGAGGWNRLAIERYVYDHQASYTDPPVRGDVTTVEAWDDQGGAWLPTQMDYTKRGLLAEVVAPAPTGTTGTRRTIDYDCTYDLLPEKICTGHLCTTAEWDVRRARIAYTTSPSGERTQYGIDALGRLASTRTPDGSTLTLEHPGASQWGTPAQELRQKLDDDATGGTLDVVTQLDGLGRTWRVTQGGTVREYDYDGASTRVARASLPHPVGQPPEWVVHLYDAADRPIAMIYPDGARERFTYAVGTSSAMNPLGAWRTTFHDAWARPVAMREDLGYCLDGTCSPKSQWTHYRWNAVGKLVEIVDDQGNQTTTSYDSLQRKLEACDPDRGCTKYAWREDGLLLDERDANGEARRLDYDGDGRPIQKSYVDASGGTTRKVQYTWDVDPVTGSPRGASLGSLTMIEDTETGTDELWYDVMGRAHREKRCIDGTCMSWAMAYDSVGRMSSLSYPDALGEVSPSSEVVQYKYDATGRLVSVPGYIDQLHYAPTDQIERMRYSNGVETVWQHDPKRLWLNHQEVTGPKGLLYTADYHHDAAGRIHQMTLANPAPVASTLGYDSLDRLTSVRSTDPAMDRDFDYDSIGNLTYHSRLGNLHYQDPRHVHAVTSTDSGNGYAYDPKGNLYKSHALELAWNQDGMPVDIIDRRTGGRTRYAYDPLGQMARRESAGGTTLIFSKLVEVAPGHVPVHYYYAGGMRIAQRRAGDVSFYHADHLGSTRVMTDGTGAVANRYDLGPFGETLASTKRVDNDFVFGPSGRDDDHGLIYMNARWMDPEIGRFISADSLVPEPFDPQSLNRYAYGRNNPISRIDPTGHADEESPGITMDAWAWHEQFYTFPDDEIIAESNNVKTTKPAPTPEVVKQTSSPTPQTVGGKEPGTAGAPVKQPDPVAKPSATTYAQWQAKQDVLNGLSPEARESWTGILQGDAIEGRYVEPTVHGLSTATRLLSFVGGPAFAGLVNAGIDSADENMRAAGRGDWDSAHGETGHILLFAATMAPFRAPVLSGLGGPRGVILKVPVSKASVGVHAGAVEAKYAIANDLIDSGLVKPRVGAQIEYDYYKSQRYVRDALYPGQTIEATQIPKGYNVDEYVARQFGGPQEHWNQQLMDSWVNSYLGGVEHGAATKLPDGTRILGFRVVWHPRRRKKWPWNRPTTARLRRIRIVLRGRIVADRLSGARRQPRDRSSATAGAEHA